MILPASYLNGFAPRDGQPLYPSLWKGCVFAAAPMLGPTGLVLRDQSGFRNNGTLTNGPAWAASQGRYAMSFDGVDDFVDYGTEINIYGLAKFSCSFWLYKTANTSGWVLNHYSSGVSGTAEYFGAADGSAIPRAVCYFGGSAISNYRGFESADCITLNQWIHVAFSVDLVTTANTICTVNGLNKSLTVITAGTPPTTFRAKNAIPWTTSKIVAFGGSPAYSTLVCDDVMLFSSFLSRETHRLLATRRGIAYEMAARRRSSVQVTVAPLRYNLFSGSIGNTDVIGAS